MKPARKVVVCEEVKQRTSSGIVMVEEDKKPELGKIIAIGEGKLPVDMKIGDIIVFRRYTDNRINIAGRTYNLIEFRDILAVQE